MVVSIRMTGQSDFSIPAVGGMGGKGPEPGVFTKEVVASFVMELIQEDQKKSRMQAEHDMRVPFLNYRNEGK